MYPSKIWHSRVPNLYIPEIALVESEKTVLIMSLVCPDKVLVATGSKASIKEQMLILKTAKRNYLNTIFTGIGNFTPG